MQQFFLVHLTDEKQSSASSQKAGTTAALRRPSIGQFNARAQAGGRKKNTTGGPPWEVR